LLLLLGLTASAKTYRIPENEPIVRIHLPDKWKTQEHEEYVETVSPDGNIHLLALPVEGNKVTEAASEAIRHMRRQGNMAVNANSFREEKVRVKKATVPMLSWDATDNGKPMQIRCYVFSASDGRRMIVMTWRLMEAEEKNRSELARILQSVTTR